MKTIYFLLAVISLQFTFAQGYPETLPDFEVYTLEDEAFTKEDLQSNTFIHFIYFSPTCGHCQDAFKFLNLKADQIQSAEVQLYLISANTTQLTNEFFDLYAPKIKELGNIHMLKDKDYKFAELFDVVAFPTSFLYRDDHSLVDVFEGASEATLFLKEVK